MGKSIVSLIADDVVILQIADYEKDSV